METAAGHYVHGSEPEEQRRLTLLNALQNSRSWRQLALRPGLRILDVGSGLGQLTRMMARAVAPSGQVVAVERDLRQIEEARRQAAEAGEEGLVDFRRGAAEDLPLGEGEWESFDLVHTRFLLEHVPDPLKVVEGMFRAARPGARVVLEDDDHDLLRLWPAVPELERVWAAYIRTYETMGNDPLVGRKLVHLLRRAGGVDVRNDTLHFGSCTTDPNFPLYVDNLAGILVGGRADILSHGGIGAGELEQGLRALRAWAARPDAAFWYATCWAAARRPADPGASVEGATRGADGEEAEAAEETLSPPRFLAESAADLSSSLRLEEVFRKISDRVHRLLDYHLFCIMLWNEERQLLEHTYSLRFGERLEQEGGFPLGYGLSGAAAEAHRPIRVADVGADSRYVRYRHAEVEVRSELAIPLILQDRLIGVLDLESTEYDAFTVEHEQILSALASHIATALDNARLYEEVRASQERMEEDLATARVIQRGLLPRAVPAVAGLEIGASWRPASELSGDFYDFVPYADGRLGLAVADVAGKGAGAAMYAATAVGILRGYVLRAAPRPSEMLAHLHEQLAGLRIPRRFLATVFAVYDPSERALTIADAGAPPPLHCTAGRASELAVGGLPLGQIAGEGYRDVRLEVAPGDVVLLYSDGVAEGRNALDRPYGVERIARLLEREAGQPAQRLADALVAASWEHTGGRPGEDDDRTVVVLRAF